MSKRFPFALALIMVFTLMGSAFVMANDEPVTSKIELDENRWNNSISHDVNEIPNQIAGTTELSFTVENNKDSKKNVLYSVIYSGEEKEIIVAAGLLTPGDKQEKGFRITKKGNYRLEMNVVNDSGEIDTNPNCKASGELHILFHERNCWDPRSWGKH